MAVAATGNPDSRLVVLRGPSGCGKSTVASGLRAALGRGVGLLSQDVIRREVLREWDLPGGAAPDLIALNARFALDAGFDLVVEGIMHAERYRGVLTGLIEDNLGRTGAGNPSASWPGTVRRARTTPT